MNFPVFIFYFITLLGKECFSLKVEHRDSVPNDVGEGNIELLRSFTPEIEGRVKLPTASTSLEENRTLRSSTQEVDGQDDTTTVPSFPSDLQDEDEQPITDEAVSASLSSNQSTLMSTSLQGVQDHPANDEESQISKSLSSSTTESGIFHLKKEVSTPTQVRNHRVDQGINESSESTTKLNSGDAMDLTGAEATVFPTMEGQRDDSASLVTQEEKGENNQIFVASSTSTPDERTEGSVGEESQEGAVPGFATSTPSIALLTPDESHFEEEIGAMVTTSSQAVEEGEILFNSASTPWPLLDDDRTTRDYEVEDSSIQTTETGFEDEKPESGLNDSIFSEKMPEFSELMDNSTAGKISSSDFGKNNSRAGNARSKNLAQFSSGSVNNGSSAAVDLHEPVREVQNLNNIGSGGSSKEDFEVVVETNDSGDESLISSDVQGERSTLVTPEREIKIEAKNLEGLSKPTNRAPASNSTEMTLENFNSNSNIEGFKPKSLAENESSSHDHENTTNSSNVKAAEIYLRLLRENQILKTLLYHIKNRASLNNRPEKNKNSSASMHEPVVEGGESVPETLTLATPVEIETSELDTDDTVKNTQSEQVISTEAPIHKIFETEKHSQNSSTDGPSEKNSSAEIDYISLDAENSSAEITSPPCLDYNYSDSCDDFLPETDPKDLRENIAKIIPTKVVYSDPQPIPSDETDELGLDDAMNPSIRKCCSLNQFFSLEVQSCHDSQGPTHFDFYVRELVLGNKSSELEFEFGRLSACPSTGDPPSIQVGISNYTHLLDLGYLYDVEMAIHFDHDSYCLEMVGHDAETAELTAAFCVETKAQQTSTSSIRKCCPLNNFFDASQGVCMPQGPGVGEIDELIREFSGTYGDSTLIETGILTCKSGISNPLGISEAYLNDGDQLCITDSGHCYPSSLYCIEYVMEEKGFHAQPMAVYCPLSSFKKCCPTHQILDNNVCADSEDPLSPYVTQLMATLYTQVGYPKDVDQVCVHLLLNSQNVRWWVTNSGYLSIDSGQNQIQTKNYCVDDSFENNEFVTIAHVCTDELKQSVGLPLSVFDKGTVGKCCPPDFHLSRVLRDCSHGKSVHVLDEDSLLMDANITKLGYTGFPHCESGKYHLYTFDKRAGDHVVFGADSRLYVVSMDGECIEMETPLENADFCLDYGWDAEEPELASAIVCAPSEYVIKYHSEKFNLISALLGVSCCSLIIALVSLIYMRVRRGLVTVRKMNTLAGRILISYVLANFIGFLALAISMHVEAKEDTSVCMVLSGIVQFFLLSAFFWNTSICSESLFLTLRVSMSEGRRLVYHSLWAWGLPAVITTTALTLDAFRDRLPCGTITLRIGHLKCIFSDSDATLIYFYGPIALTLVANMVLLLSSKQARFSKLQRLEKGPNKPPSASSSVVTNNQNRVRKTTVTSAPSPSHSGMRTHQNRNLWSESVRLVVWSGLTWVLEVIGFIVPRYVSFQQERWHDYLWYLPASVNSLRGFGIFFILVMTPETRSKILRAIGTFKGKSSAMWKSGRSQAPSKNNSYQPRSNNVSMNISSSKYSNHNVNKTRNMSVATTLTNLTNLNSSLHGQNNGVHPRLIHSISQMERRESTTSSLSSIADEDIENLELGGRRRSSVAPIALPSVDEEDDEFLETSLEIVPVPKGSPTDSVFARDSEA